MSSGTRILVKILVAVVSYGVVFALAIFAIGEFGGEETSPFVWVILAVLAICGYKAIKHLPFPIFSGGAFGEGFVWTMLALFLRVFLSVFAGVFIAPWMIAKKLVSLIPGGKEEGTAAAAEAEEEE